MKRTLGLVLIALHAPFAAAVYRCVDEQGRTRFGDTPPSGCGHVPIYEVTPSGNVIRRIDPTPTPQQLELRQEERERRKKEELAAAEQKRRDTALLSTYDSPAELDMARDRNIEPVHGRIAAARERIKELDVREKQIDEQMKTYTTSAKPGKEGQAPAWLVANLEQVHRERRTLEDAIVRYHKEIEDLRRRYDADKRRWLALKAAGGSLPPPEASAPQAEPAKALPSHRRLGS